VTTTIAVPVWLAVVVMVLALWALLDRLLVPSVRWLIRSRANKVLDEVGQRLRLQVRPFQQTSRRSLIDRLVFDEKVQQAATAFAQANKMPREVAHAIVERYAREIVPAFNAYFYFRIGAWLSKKVSRLLYRVRIGYSDEAGLAAVPANATVVFVMNHRSNMDYVLGAHPGRRAGGAVVRGGRMGAHLAAAADDARDGRLLRAAQFGQCAVPHACCRTLCRRWPPPVASRRRCIPEGGLTRGRPAAPNRSSACSTTCCAASTLEGEDRRDLVFVPVWD
jgi:hypothetical protein